MSKFWNAALTVGGLATVGAFVFWSLYNQWLHLPIFSQMSGTQTFAIMIIFLCLVFLSLITLAVVYVRKEKGGQAVSGPQQAFELHESWEGVNEIDCDNLIGPDVVRAARAMTMTASSWLNKLVDKKIIIENHFGDFETLYKELMSCDKVVPGFEKKKTTCKQFVSSEMKTAYQEMKRYRSTAKKGGKK